MKLHPESTGYGCETAAGNAAKTTRLVNKSVAEAGILENFRRLKPDEVVGSGDFVKNGHRGIEPWEGPSGFRAASFVKPVYRRQKAG